VVRLEAVHLRLPWICPEWTGGEFGVVHSMREFRDEEQASYVISIGSDFKSCLGSNSFLQCGRFTDEMRFISSGDLCSSRD